MQEREKELREVAKKLLLEKKVDLIIGYEEGTLPLRTRPVFIQEAGEASRLVWNSRCENSLCSYLKTTKGRVGMVAKGCDIRSIIGLIGETG